MALGILEPSVQHVAGTVYVYHAEQRRAALLANVNLKKDKTGRVILVPQPSNDPNDPLVRSFTIGNAKTLTITELASMAARSYPGYIMLRLLRCHNSLTSSCG
jgi:hypothetical protein